MTEALAEPAETPSDPPVEAPYGWVIDKNTGQRRPRLRPGRRRLSVAVENTDQPTDVQAPISRDPDITPGTTAAHKPKPSKEIDVPPFRAGPIAKGMNRLYTKTGKLLRTFDKPIGEAVIAAARKDSDDDTTVGEAWEEIAKTNPRVRAFLLRLISGGAWSSLLMAHAPIMLALLMRDGIRKYIPLMKIAEAVLVDDEPDGETQDPTGLGLNPGDLAQMMTFMQNSMGQMAANLPRDNGWNGRDTA